MDLIYYNLHSIINTDISHAGQLLFRPKASAWILRAAYQDQLCFRIFCLHFQLLEIHLIITVFIHKGIVYNMTACFINIIIVRIINRRLDDNVISRICEQFNGKYKGKIQSRCICDPFFFNIPVITSFLPVNAGHEKFIRKIPISVILMSCTVLDRFCHCRSCLKIHICNTQWDHIALSIHLLTKFG